MKVHDLNEQIVRQRGGGSLVRSYLKAILEGGSDQKRFQVTGCGASDASVVAIHTAILFRILIKMSLARSVEHGTWPFLPLLGQRILTRLNK
jgi:hypothetical protein